MSSSSTIPSETEFESTFSLLPEVFKIVRTLQAQSDPKKQQAQLQVAVSDLSSRLQTCHQVLSSYPCLNTSPKEQKESLEKKRQQLKEKCEQILMCKDLEILQLPSEHNIEH